MSAYLDESDIALLDEKVEASGKTRSEYIKAIIIADLMRIDSSSLEQRVKLLEEWKEEFEAQRRGR